MATGVSIYFGPDHEDKVPVVLEGLSAAFAEHGLATEEVSAYTLENKNEIVIATEAPASLWYDSEKKKAKDRAEWDRIHGLKDQAVEKVLTENGLRRYGTAQFPGPNYQVTDI